MNNINNKLINRQIIETIINKYIKNDYIYINNIQLYQKAFIQKSFSVIDINNSESDNNCVIYSNDLLLNNERLEFLGDKVIDLITTEYLFDTFPHLKEGELTTLKSRIVKKESLCVLGDKLNFKEYLLLSSTVERISGRNNPRFMEDVFESFMGAFFKDQNSNYNLCKKFLLGVYKEHIDINFIMNNNDNFKDSLLKYFHSKKWGHPVYNCIYFSGSTYSREFTTIIEVQLDNLTNCINNTIIKNIICNNNNIITNIKVIMDNIISNNIETDVDSLTYSKLIETLTKDNKIIIGIGHAHTKKMSEQNCSKDCLDNLHVSY